MAETTIRLENVTKVYRQARLGRALVSRGVEDLSFEVRDGETFGLVGLNGSGKTTTIKLILGLLFPNQGNIIINDLPVPHPYAQARLGYLPETPYFYRNLNPTEILTLYGTLSKMDAKRIPHRIEDVLRQVKMTHAAKKPMREFSKGMLQRIGLAQALLHDPDILILDEPVSGLDPLGLHDVRQLILDLNQKGKTILLSSHSMTEVEKLSHRVGILVDGRLVKTLSKSHWEKDPGNLEKTFVQTLKDYGPVVPK